MKKFLSILLATMMVLAMVGTAFADFTITAPDSTVEHTYYVYQIFTGTMSDDATNKALGDLKWGTDAKLPSGVDVGDNVTDDQLATLKALESTASDATKLAVMLNYVNLDSTTYGTVTSGSTLTVEPGYYLITDSDAESDNPLTDKDEAATTHLVKVCANITIQPKTAKPSVDKKVQDENDDAELTAVNGWGETADHEINESFQFKLIATLPADEDFEAYKEYKVVFTDTMSSGVTFESIESVTVDSAVVAVADYSHTATAGQAGGSWTLTIDDIKKYDTDLTDGAVVEVVYNAHLNENAEVTTAAGGTTNSNKVELQFSNNPYTEGLGKTGPDYVWVYTFQINNTKYKEATTDGNQLAGAGFTLYDAAGTTISLIDKGNGLYVVADQDATENIVTEMVTGDTGVFNIKGLDAGTYTIEETTVPAGYNKCDNVVIEIEAVHAENTEGTAPTTTLTMTPAQSINYINKQGASLPETGGIGTTLFYLFGGIMAAGSALILIVRRRADAEEE